MRVTVRRGGGSRASGCTCCRRSPQPPSMRTSTLYPAERRGEHVEDLTGVLHVRIERIRALFAGAQAHRDVAEPRTVAHAHRRGRQRWRRGRRRYRDRRRGRRRHGDRGRDVVVVVVVVDVVDVVVVTNTVVDVDVVVGGLVVVVLTTFTVFFFGLAALAVVPTWEKPVTKRRTHESASASRPTDMPTAMRLRLSRTARCSGLPSTLDPSAVSSSTQVTRMSSRRPLPSSTRRRSTGTGGTARPTLRAASAWAAGRGRTAAESGAHAEVAGRPHIEPSALEHQEHLRGPLADAAHHDELAYDLGVGELGRPIELDQSRRRPFPRGRGSTPSWRPRDRRCAWSRPEASGRPSVSAARRTMLRSGRGSRRRRGRRAAGSRSSSRVRRSACAPDARA